MTQITTDAPKALTDGGSPSSRKIDYGDLMHRYGTVVILVVLLIVARSMSDVFLTERNLLNVLRQIAGTGLISVGMLFVILTRGIDLSVGSIAALGSVASALLLRDMAPGFSILATLAVGGAFGLLSGILIAYLRLPPFVTTLAVMTIARGSALIASQGQPIKMGDAGTMIVNFGSGYALGIPQPVLLMLAVFVLAGVVLTFTRFGRMVKAIGSNAEAVRLSGISVSRYVVSVYVISGVLAAAAGIISSSRTGIGSATVPSFDVDNLAGASARPRSASAPNSTPSPPW